MNLSFLKRMIKFNMENVFFITDKTSYAYKTKRFYAWLKENKV